MAKRYHSVIIGFGRAGQARLSALHQLEQQHVTIITKRPNEVDRFVAEKKLAGLEVSIAQDWQKILTDSQVQTVFICSENALHYRQVSYALEQQKHVCVEFPLCSDLEQAQALYALAHKHDRVLHVESIGTLTSRHQELRALVQTQQIKRLEFDFTGSLYRWLLDEVRAKHFAQLSFGRLSQCVDLFPEVKVESAYLHDEIHNQEGQVDVQAYSLTLQLHTKQNSSNIQIQLHEQRRIGAKRSSQIRAYSDQGLITLAPLQRNSLFLLDSQHFLALVEHQEHKSNLDNDPRYIYDYANPKRVIATFALIKAINYVL